VAAPDDVRLAVDAVTGIRIAP